MTKVQIRFRPRRPLDDALFERLAAAHTVYGIGRMHVEADTGYLTVEYDASRLQVADVEALLAATGIPVEAPA